MDTDPALVSTSIDSNENFDNTINDKIYRLKLNSKCDVMIKDIVNDTYLSRTIKIARCEG